MTLEKNRNKYNTIYSSFQKDVITICFTLKRSSDDLNWVCLFVCLFLENFETLWKMAGGFKFDIEVEFGLNLG